jgi:hypothetical protein
MWPGTKSPSRAKIFRILAEFSMKKIARIDRDSIHSQLKDWEWNLDQSLIFHYEFGKMLWYIFVFSELKRMAGSFEWETTFYIL